MPSLRSPRVRTRLFNLAAPPPEQPVVLVYAPTTAAARPATPGGKGLHRATDTGAVSYFDGTSWRPVTVRGTGLVEVAGGDFVSPARSAATVLDEALGGMMAAAPLGAVLIHDGAGGLALCANDLAALFAANDTAGARTALVVYSKAEVDNALALLAGGVSAKPNVQAATVASIANLSAVVLASVFSGYVPAAGDRVLVKDDASPDGLASVSDLHNGWYLVGTVGGGVAPLTRVSDANASAEFHGVTTCLIARGSLAGRQYKTAQPASFVLGTDPIVFTEIPATPLGSATPLPLGAASPGTSGAAAHEDHVHAMPSASDVGAVPVGRTLAGLDLSANRSASDLRTALSVYSAAQVDAAIAASSGGTHGAGTLAARPSSPAAGDTWAVTSGVATGDKYECFVAGAWVLVAYDRSLILPGTTPWAHWRLDEASGSFASQGSQSGQSLSVSTGTVIRQASLATGRTGALLSAARLGGSSTTPSSTRRCSLLAWVENTAISGTSQVIGYSANPHATPYATMSLGLDTSNRLRVYHSTSANPSSHNPVTGTSSLVRTGRLTLLVLVFDGDATDKLTAYVDERADYAGTPTPGTDLNWSITGGAWCVGANFGNESVSGCYGDVAVYDGVALSAAQVREIHQRSLGLYAGQ